MGPDIKAYEKWCAANGKTGKSNLLCAGTVDVDLKELTDLIYYCDNVAKILKDHGFQGKAEALENRYMKFKYLIDT